MEINMEVTVGSAVRSKAGHDKGGMFIVIARDGEYAYLADGKTRKTENPKRKKLKHLQPSAKISEAVVNALNENGSVTNAEVRKALAELGGYNSG